MLRAMSFAIILPFLRPIESLILDEEVSEVMVNPSGQVFVERRGEVTEAILLPFTTANFLYIASCSLIPELQRERGLRQSLAQTIFFIAGCSLMFVSSGASNR